MYSSYLNGNNYYIWRWALKKRGFITLECIISMFILSIIVYMITFSINNSFDLLNKNKTKENITENEANVMETAAILCKLVLNLYGGKLEIKQRFNDVNIELQSVNNIDYTLRNGLELIKEDFIEEEFQKIYNL